MNIEKIKTFILTVLVGISFLLTFSLWNYQPSLEYLSDDRNEYINEVDLGGVEETRKTIIEPHSIIFHKDSQYFGFNDPILQQKLYEKMQEWQFDDYTLTSGQVKPMNNYQVEIIFPTLLPIEIIKSLFTINDEDVDLPSWSFKRAFVTFNQTYSVLQISFLSIDGLQQAKFVVKDSSVYNYLWSYINSETGLSEYFLYDESNGPIYLPMEPLQIKNRSITVQTISPYLLVNALFPNPSNVSPNIGEAYFTDGQRGMNVLNDNRSIEFINPIHSNGEHMDPLALLDRSLTRINEHKGWTNKFTLTDMNTYNNEIHYRMQYEGYPVFSRTSDGELSVIEQQWLNHDLHLYRRPLFRLENLLGGETVTLPSGNDLIHYLQSNDYYDQTQIYDIQVGYKLTYIKGTYSLTLDPAWYMNYKGNWLEVMLDDEYLEGVN